MKYIRVRDDELFDEDEVWDAVDEDLGPDDIEEAMGHFSLMTLFKHLDEEMQNMIYEQAKQTVFDEYFFEVKEEEEDLVAEQKFWEERGAGWLPQEVRADD